MLSYELSEVLPGAVHKVVTVHQITSASEPDSVCEFHVTRQYVDCPNPDGLEVYLSELTVPI